MRTGILPLRADAEFLVRSPFLVGATDSAEKSRQEPSSSPKTQIKRLSIRDFEFCRKSAAAAATNSRADAAMDPRSEKTVLLVLGLGEAAGVVRKSPAMLGHENPPRGK